MTERTGDLADEPTSRLWYVEDGADASDPALDSPQITHDDAIIAGGDVKAGQTGASDDATIVLPAGDAALAESSPAVAASADAEPADEAAPAATPADEESHEPTDTAAPAESATTPETTEPTRAGAITRAGVADKVAQLEHAPAGEADEDLETTQVRRQSLLSVPPIGASVPERDGTPATPEAPGDAHEAAPAPTDGETRVMPGPAKDVASGREPQAPVTAPAVSPAPAAPPMRHTLPEQPAARATMPERLDDVIFDGATALPSVPSRVPAHLWSLLLTLVLLPVAWYLACDGATRLYPDTLPFVGADLRNVAGLLELAGAAAAIFLVVLLARWSSLGAFLWGTFALAVGGAFLGLQAAGSQLVTDLNPTFEALRRAGGLFANVAQHLALSLTTGIIPLAGVVLIALGFVSHGARRKGRRDFQVQQTIDRYDS